MVLFLLGWADPSSAVEDSARSAQSDDYFSARIANRIVKSFDFDERKRGNYEQMPMNWRRIVAPGYPRFLEARFDTTVGHDAPASFFLPLQGGSLGAYYLAKDIPVHPRSEYRISAWIRPRDLKYARAYVTAYYLDDALRKIEGSERKSHGVRSFPDQMSWQRVVIDLPGGDGRARWIGLSCRVEQSSTDSSQKPLYQPIDYHDVNGAAWFDDINVIRLPRIHMTLNVPTAVFLPDQRTEIQVGMEDINGEGLAVDLDIQDTEGQIVESHHLKGADLISKKVSVAIRDLPFGRYMARLTVRVGRQFVSKREQDFLRLGRDLSHSSQSTKSTEIHQEGWSGRPHNLESAVTLDHRRRYGFGIIADSSLFDHRAMSESLMRVLSPAMVKVPLWRDDLSDQDVVRGDPRGDVVVESLHRQGITVVGVLNSPPHRLAEQYKPAERSLLAILASDPQKWRPYLALMMMRHGPWINAWQVGPDAVSTADPPTHLARVLANVSAEMEPLIGRPRLVIPRSVEYPVAQGGLDAEVLSLTIPSYAASSRLGSQLDGLRANRVAARWATIESPPSNRYLRRWRLIELARRLIIARSSGMDAVFARQPWHFQMRDGDAIVSPEESFIFLRTLNQTLGNLKPDRPVPLGSQWWAWLYAKDTAGNDGRASGLHGGDTLVVWTDASEKEKTQLVLDVGEQARQIDLWGNVRVPQSVEHGRAFSIGALPEIIRPVASWRIRMLASFTLDNPSLQPTIEEHQRILTLKNTHDMKLSGRLQLRAPSGWQIHPSQIDLALKPGESRRIKIQLRIPGNQASGEYTLYGHLRVEGEGFGNMTLRTRMKVEALGMDVNVIGYRQGDVMNIVQRITNRTGGSLDLRAYLIYPHHARRSRVIRNLAAGQTVVREYQIQQAAKRTGQVLRLSVEQINGPLRHNAIMQIH